MKHRMKQVTALMCATLMTVSSCLTNGAFVSQASEGNTEAVVSGRPVITINNPGIGVNVGERIDLSQYSVQFTEGEAVLPENLEWYENKELKVIPFRSPAIGVVVNTTVDLTDYAVEFTEGTATPVVTWKNGDTVIHELKVEQKGVYQLKAIDAEGTEKFVYVVAKNADDEKYVLYRNDFDGSADVVSTNDFVNNTAAQFLTKLRTKSAHSKYKVLDGYLSMERWHADTDAAEVSSLDMHLLLPNWLGEFGDYNVDMQAKLRDNSAYRFKGGLLGIDLRAQYDYDGDDATNTDNTIEQTLRLEKNYCVRLTWEDKIYATDYSKEGNACNGSAGSNYAGAEATGLDVYSDFILSARAQDNTYAVKVTQGDTVYEEVTKERDRANRTGRIGIWAYLVSPLVDYVEVCLVDTPEETISGNARINTFAAKEKGVSQLTVKNTVTNAEKTIYIVAKNADETEYVMWENNFDSAEDAPYYEMGTTNDYEGFGRLYGSATYSVNAETGRLEVTTGSSRGHYRFPKWIGDFGNYRVQMTEKTAEYKSETTQIGLFARGGESKNYTPNYSVLLRYKGFASDGIALKVRKEWVDDNTKLSYDADMVWGKVLNRSPLKPENEYTHELLVQDDLMEYKINGNTRLYDIREKEYQTGYVGILLESGITISIDSVRVLFVPDITAPDAPVSATYTRTTTVPGLADGKVKVKLASTGDVARDVLCYWGNGTSELPGYAHFGKTVVEEGAKTVTVDLGTNIMVPEGATELRVYTENHAGRSTQFVSVSLPAGMSPLTTGEEITSFQVISDTHITKSAAGYASLNFKKFLEDVSVNDPNSMGIFIGGDLVDKGNQAEYDNFWSIWNGVETEQGVTLPQMHAVIGNHEFWGTNEANATGKNTYEETVALFNKNTGAADRDTLYYDEEVDGYHFIYLATSKLEKENSPGSHTNAILGTTQLAWFEEKMQAYAEDNKPIFVFLHQPLQETVAGSGTSGVQEHNEVKAILENYPQAFLFTSHSHVDLNTPSTMISSSEGLCNMFNTSAISYLMNMHYTDRTITSDGAQAYYVEVYKDKVLVRGKDVITNEWLPSAQFVVNMKEEMADSFDITAGGSDVSYLDGSFDVYQYNKPSTKADAYAVEGPVKPSDINPESGKSYFTTEAYGTYSAGGLKPTSIPGGNDKGGYSVLTFNKGEMKNFTAEYEFYGSYGLAFGLAFGSQPGVFPVSLDGKTNDKGVALYMDNNGQLYVYGAIDRDNVVYPDGVTISTKLSSPPVFVNGATYIRAKGMTNGETLDVIKTVKADSPTWTICVSVQNGILTVYEKNHKELAIQVPLTDAYTGGYVSLYGTTKDQGAFKKFEIVQLKDWDYDMKVKLQGSSVAYLDDAFDVYQFANPTTTAKTTATLGPVDPSDTYTNDSGSTYSYFTTQHYGNYTNGGLKPTVISAGESKGYAALTYTMDTVKDFEAEYDIYPGHAINGIMFGGKPGVFPVSLDNNNDNDTGVAIYVANKGQFSVWGAIDTTNITKTNEVITLDTNPSATDYAFMKNTSRVRITKMTGETVDNSVPTVNENTDYYTICIKVKDGILTLHEKDHPNRAVSIPLSSKYKGGYVSLIANNTQSGAFRGFRITKLTENYDFRNSTTEELDAYFDSYYFAEGAEGVKGSTISEQWYQTQSNQSAGMGTLAIKPTHANKDNQVSILTLRNENVKNFEASVEYYTSYVPCGIMVASEGKLATEQNGVKVLVNGDGKIIVQGAIDISTGSWSGDGDAVNGASMVTSPALPGYIKPSTENAAYKTRYVLTVRVVNGILSASVSGFEGVLTVKLTGNYEGGKISLPSHGRDQGGFWQFEFKTLDVTPVQRTAFPFDLSTDGEYVKVEVSTDAVYSKVVGDFKYDAKQFEFVTAEIADAYQTINANAQIVPTDGIIPLELIVNKNTSAKLVTLYFKEKADTLDYTGFILEDADVLSSGGISAVRVDNPMDIAYDYTADKVIDVRDLVNSKKNNIDEIPVQTLLIGKTLRSVSENNAVIVSENVTLEGGQKLGSKGITTIYRDMTLDFANITDEMNVELAGSVILDNVQVTGLQNQVRVYANGFDFQVNENVTFDGQMKRVYGGSIGGTTMSTNITLLAGAYEYIYGGSNEGQVLGDTNVIVGGNVNSEINVADHQNLTNIIYGGGVRCAIKGDTHVTILDSAQAHYVFGGGYYAESVIDGTCYVNIKGGNVMGYYGGGRKAPATKTVITMTAGTAEQVMGGCLESSMTGETNVTILGGTITRRVYGGCYNDGDYELFGGGATYGTEYYVTGNTNVTIGGTMVFNPSIKMEYAICAASRHNVNHAEEIATLNITSAYYESLKSYIEGTLMVPYGYDVLNKTN